MKLKILLIIFLAILPQIVLAQTDFSFGLESGISLASKQPGWGYAYEKNTPLISPLIGINGLLKIPDHFQINTAIQYEYIGYQTGPGHPEEIKYHKLCIPFTFGISFGESKIKPAVYIGYRPNFLLAGKYKEWDGYSTVDIDPFSYDLNRFTNQFTTGISTNFGNSLVINLSYSAGQLIDFGDTYTHYSRYGPVTHTFDGISLKNNEFTISLTYLFNSKKTTD